MLAVIDKRGTVGVAPYTSLEDLSRAHWIGHSSTAHAVPANFLAVSFSVFIWQYVVRCSCAHLLPSRYRTKPIFWRRPPKVPQKLVADDHWKVMREVAADPRTFAELASRLGFGEKALARHLAALYLSGAITTDPRRARGLAGRGSFGAQAVAANDTLPSGPSGLPSGPSSLGSEPNDPPRDADYTVPAHLGSVPGHRNR